MEIATEKIFELYIQRLSGTLSAEEESYVQEQLAQDPAFKAQWDLLVKEDESMNAGGYLQTIDSDTALHAIKEERKEQTPAKVVSIKKFLIAAAMILLLGSSLLVFFFQNKTTTVYYSASAVQQQQKKAIRLVMNHGEAIELSKDSTKTIALNNATLNTGNGGLQYTSSDTVQNTLDVPAGENYKLTLSDGTEVWLNAATRLRFPFHFGPSTREVYVEGEAYFNVAKDAQRPFVVRTALNSVQVLGTAFNINTYQAGSVKTSLVSGSVIAHGKGNEKQTLQPGIQADYGAGKGFKTSHFDEEEVSSWRNGVYYYHRMPLVSLIEEATRFYGMRFVIDKDKFAGKSVTGLMDRNRLDDFLSDLKTTAQVEYQVSGSEIILR
ncbi:FecR family protein [Chitinophaga sp.]|uniref:FecR family protein n=1 Tax=Chitinophaga sp. TaxID=1869181 RepID=UPI002F9380BA